MLIVKQVYQIYPNAYSNEVQNSDNKSNDMICMKLSSRIANDPPLMYT